MTGVGIGEVSEAKRGRPSDYNPEIAAEVCGKIAQGQSVRSISAEPGMPGQTTIYQWLQAHDEFAVQYARAREAQAEHFQDEILSIADDGRNDTYEDENGGVRTDQDVIARSRLRVDTRKWLMSKLAPKKYGDKLTQEHTGPGGGPVQLERIERIIVDPKNPDSEGLPPAA
jgi:hypothetical protein